MIGVRIKTEGFAEMRKKLIASRRRVDNPAEFTDYVAARAYREQMKHFEDERGPDGAWKPLDPQTIRRRRLGGGGAKILQDTRGMMNSIVPASTKKTASVICNKHYGVHHQKGTKNIPQRKFLWVDDAFLDDMGNRYAKYVKGNLT